jgi:hypothetical protein
MGGAARNEIDAVGPVAAQIIDLHVLEVQRARADEVDDARIHGGVRQARCAHFAPKLL